MSTGPLAAPSNRSLTPDQAARYNSTGLQRARILEALQAAGGRGVTGPELAKLANAPCVTKRISELRSKDVAIRTEPVAVAGPDGSINTVALYVLDSGPGPQAGLFD